MYPDPPSLLAPRRLPAPKDPRRAWDSRGDSQQVLSVCTPNPSVPGPTRDEHRPLESLALPLGESEIWRDPCRPAVQLPHQVQGRGQRPGRRGLRVLERRPRPQPPTQAGVHPETPVTSRPGHRGRGEGAGRGGGRPGRVTGGRAGRGLPPGWLPAAAAGDFNDRSLGPLSRANPGAATAGGPGGPPSPAPGHRVPRFSRPQGPN